MNPATALANPNIAFIKYWGNRDEQSRLPANGSISMNLDGLETRTTVLFDATLDKDKLRINGKIAGDLALARVSVLLDEVRSMSDTHHFARVDSANNFPIGTGIASSASAFAALALAATTAAGLHLNEVVLSRLARRSSGSACRSIPGGFVEWFSGRSDADSYAASIAPPGFWDLVDCIAVISTEHKPTGSTEGHALAGTSPLQSARVSDAPRRLDICRRAILQRDFNLLVEIVEVDSNLMHAVMRTSCPPLFYWEPATLDVMLAVQSARVRGLPACCTVDAGPNVHVICTGSAAEESADLLRNVPGVSEVRLAKAGGPARLVENSIPGSD